MLGYNISFARSARKELQALPIDVAERLLKKIESLALNPRPSGCTKLRGATGLWRIRSGDYRVIYKVDDSKRIVDVILIRHRREIYR
jgi:mRNA interferase RelE/StbE